MGNVVTKLKAQSPMLAARFAAGRFSFLRRLPEQRRQSARCADEST